MSISQRTLDDLYTSRTQRLKRTISAQMPRHMVMQRMPLGYRELHRRHQALRDQVANRRRTRLVVERERGVEVSMAVLQTVEIAHV